MGQTEYPKLHIMRGNSKLGKLLYVSLPPGKSCPKKAPCYNEGCYARKFCTLRKECAKACEDNWTLATKFRKRYFAHINAVITLKEPPLFRWHVFGDIPDADYLDQMMIIARNNPSTKFLCFTKQYGLACGAADWDDRPMPKNLQLVLSAWPGYLSNYKIMEHSLPVAWARDPKNPDPRIPATAHECDGGCDKCGLCWNLKPGESVVFDKH